VLAVVELLDWFGGDVYEVCVEFWLETVEGVGWLECDLDPEPS
jgi:hypothetical protein